jgi:large subunit ribosomal protein L30
MANDEQKPVAKKKVAKKTVAKKAASKKAPAKKAASAPQASSAAGNGSKAANAGRMRVTLIKSLIGTIGHHRDTVRGLGLRRLNHTVELEDTPATRGMVKKVQYLVRVEKG